MTEPQRCDNYYFPKNADVDEYVPGFLAHHTLTVITSYYGCIARHGRLAGSGSWAIRIRRRCEYFDGIFWKHQRAAQPGFRIGWQRKRDGDRTMVVG